MDTEQVKRRTVSASARDKCIKCARKVVESQEKWGRCLAVFYAFLGLVLFGMGVWFIALVQNFARTFGNVGPAGQNPFWQGFVGGMALGFVMIGILFHAVKAIVECVKSLRPRILVEYHDALVNLMHDQGSHLPCESDIPTSQDSLSPSESNA